MLKLTLLLIRDTSDRLPIIMTEGEWNDFAVRCTGEWEGRQRLYSGDGKVVPIPDWLVPDEYTQWGIPFNDMLTQMSVKVTDEGVSGKVVRQIPQVYIGRVVHCLVFAFVHKRRRCTTGLICFCARSVAFSFFSRIFQLN